MTFALYGGSDDCVLQSMALGAHGVISVAANLIPDQMHAMVMDWIRGDPKACREKQFRWMPLIRRLFSEVSPIPVKAALSMMGRIEDTLRLPLVPLSESAREALRREMKRMELIQ